MKKKWLGKIDKCDLCGKELSMFSEFIDGRTDLGSWALMCPICHHLYGVGLGAGRGQMYDYNSREKLEG